MVEKIYTGEVKSRNDGNIFKIIIIIYQLIVVKELNYDCVENEYKKLVTNLPKRNQLINNNNKIYGKLKPRK